MYAFNTCLLSIYYVLLIEDLDVTVLCFQKFTLYYAESEGQINKCCVCVYSKHCGVIEEDVVILFESNSERVMAEKRFESILKRCFY